MALKKIPFLLVDIGKTALPVNKILPAVMNYLSRRFSKADA